MASATAVIMSDVQLPWCSKGSYNTGSYDDVPCAVHENHMLVQGIHRVGKLRWEVGSNDVVERPLGAFINGDLTAYGHDWQWDLFRKIWETQPGEDDSINMKLPIWPALGNHDYANNVEDSWFAARESTWTGYGNNGDAQRSIAYIRAAVGKCGGSNTVPNFGGMVDHYDKTSAAYTVNFGSIRMVMLHNYPTYSSSALTGYESTLDFLRQEVVRANETNDYLVLVWHDYGDHLEWYKGSKHSSELAEIAETIQGARVIGIFCAHLHYLGGRMLGDFSWRPGRGSFATHDAILNRWGERIPVIRSWSAEAQRFLVVQWNVYNCTWRFAAVNAPANPGGDPTWVKHAGFDGNWTAATRPVGKIEGHKLFLHSGGQEDLMFPGKTFTKVNRNVAGISSQGELWKNGELHWNNGDVWTRAGEVAEQFSEWVLPDCVAIPRSVQDAPLAV